MNKPPRITIPPLYCVIRYRDCVVCSLLFVLLVIVLNCLPFVGP
jgi:hypothetical protein